MYMMTLARTPGAAFGMRQLGEPPEHMPTIDFFERGYWLHLFSEDLLTVEKI